MRDRRIPRFPIDPERERGWRVHAASILAFSAIAVAVLQVILPL